MCKDGSIQYRCYRHVFIRLDIATSEKFMPRSKGALQDKLYQVQVAYQFNCYLNIALFNVFFANVCFTDEIFIKFHVHSEHV